MKLLIIICMFLSMPVFAQEGVNFRDLNFEKALAAAKEEGKLVFMDCYASWCGPCRQMTEKVFPLKEAGEYFNPRFVCVKYDMEQGEGVELAERFDVQAYPTFLIIRPDGIVQHKIVGGGGLEEFIARVEEGLSEETSLSHLEQLYQEGKAGKQQTLLYLNLLIGAAEEEKAEKVAEALISQLTDEERVQPEYWSLYQKMNYSLDSPMFKFLLAHLPEFRENVGKEKVDAYLVNKYGAILSDYVMGYNDENTEPFHLLEEQIPLLGLEQQEVLNDYLELASLVYYKKMEELAGLIREGIDSLDMKTLLDYACAYHSILWALQDENLVSDWKRYSKELADLLVSQMETKVNDLDVQTTIMYFSILHCFQPELSPDIAERLLAIGKTLLPRLPENDQEKAMIKLTFEEIGKIVKSNKGL